MMKRKASFPPLRLLVAAAFFSLSAALTAQDQTKDRPSEVGKALAQAGDNRPELEKALQDCPNEQRKAMAFLIANMPQRDLRSLRADFLLQNVELAYKARKDFPWGAQIPEDIFLNDVLPYANVDEARHPWRRDLYELCAPLVKQCKTPAEAAQRLNATIFAKLKVRYSTERKLPNQSPKESIEQGRASCTGLSILLCDACRSVAVPARLAGTPMWANNKGNHTWVEIWSDGWHFTGAAEPDAKGLDRAWFTGIASEAKKDSPQHAIYAVHFRRTNVIFPLVWAAECKDFFAENVTDRYTGGKASAPQAKKTDKKSDLTKEQTEQIDKAARAFFAASVDEQKKWRFDAALDRALADREDIVRRAVWEAYRATPMHEKMKKDFDENRVNFEKHLSAYTIRKVGERPANGWPLVIALHGGGGAPKEVNDSQWRIMQRYYRDQSAVTGYQYLALRAPNDLCNGFYDDYVPPLILNLIRQFLLFGDIDPDKVYLLGYSHGGYGAFFIGPKIPDHFAAIHSSAAAPTDGTISPRTLRNTRFTFMIGDKDNAYGRRQRCEAFNEQIQKLQRESKNDFPVAMELKKGFGHGGLPDRDKIKEIYAFSRNPVPRCLTWDLTDPLICHFFWLSVVQPSKSSAIDATLRGNHLDVTTRKIKQFAVDLDGRLIDFGRPLRITLNGKERTIMAQPSFRTLCETMRERGDPQMSFSYRLSLEGEGK